MVTNVSGVVEMPSASRMKYETAKREQKKPKVSRIAVA